FDAVDHKEAVGIVAVTNDGKIVMTRESRPIIGIGRMLGIPAGLVESGEDPAVAAVRELEEETGYHAKKIQHLISYYSSPGFTNEKLHAYLATDLTKTQ